MVAVPTVISDLKKVNTTFFKDDGAHLTNLFPKTMGENVSHGHLQSMIVYHM